MIVKQYGLQRTGTNATKALLEANCRDVTVLTTTLGSKHDNVDWAQLQGRAVKFVVNIKDPASWLCSYYRFRSRKALDESPPRAYDPIETLVDEWLAYWAVRTKSHLGLADVLPERTAVIQHEALLRHPLDALMDTALHLELPVRTDEVELFRTGYALRGGEGDRGAQLIDPARPFDRGMHLSLRWSLGVPNDVLVKARRFLDDFLREHPQWRSLFDLTHLAGTAAEEST